MPRHKRRKQSSPIQKKTHRTQTAGQPPHIRHGSHASPTITLNRHAMPSQDILNKKSTSLLRRCFRLDQLEARIVANKQSRYLVHLTSTLSRPHNNSKWAAATHEKQEGGMAVGWAGRHSCGVPLFHCTVRAIGNIMQLEGGGRVGTKGSVRVGDGWVLAHAQCARLCMDASASQRHGAGTATHVAPSQACRGVVGAMRTQPSTRTRRQPRGG